MHGQGLHFLGSCRFRSLFGPRVGPLKNGRPHFPPPPAGVAILPKPESRGCFPTRWSGRPVVATLWMNSCTSESRAGWDFRPQDMVSTMGFNRGPNFGRRPRGWGIGACCTSVSSRRGGARLATQSVGGLRSQNCLFLFFKGPNMKHNQTTYIYIYIYMYIYIYDIVCTPVG